ncbi:alanine racemase [Methylobacterium sp. WL64]|uniref:alanine racemase n=1 Tax=Methylobacterium sp. WL64 TaxID=2603894 RepID=UPI001AED63FE|nr:alanine racemase [Methylobacterium sp. WL64]
MVILEKKVQNNLERTIAASNGPEHLVPHVKTHRANWIVRLMLDRGIRNFKCATPAEVELVLSAGSPGAIWAYPSVNRANIARVIAMARRYPDAEVSALVDSFEGLAAWRETFAGNPANVRLRVDLDVGMGRTGIPVGAEARKLALAIQEAGLFGGWHAYDGHIHGNIKDRRREVQENASAVSHLMNDIRAEGVDGDLVAGGSYSFNLWPGDIARYVSPGSWTYSSAQHNVDLRDLGWEQAAFVLTTVVSKRAGTATLDAGSKAISPDKPIDQRFFWKRRIISMSEEHTVVEADELEVGDRLLLTPQHACTTAYLYDRALVQTEDGRWETRGQLGNAR